jgi:hypothetical protein
MIRGGIYALLAIVALACNLAALGTDIAQWGTNNPKGPKADSKLTPWYLCGPRGTGCTPAGEVDCQGFQDRMRAMEAFYVLSAIFLLLAIIFAVLDHGNVHQFRHYRKILLGLSFLIIACSIIGWALALTLVLQNFCDGSSGGDSTGSAGQERGSIRDAVNFEWWASPFLLVVTTFFGIIMFIVAHRAPALATAK